MKRKILTLVISTVSMLSMMLTGCSETDDSKENTTQEVTGKTDSESENNTSGADNDVTEDNETEGETTKSNETEKKELSYDEKKECANEIIKAIKECDLEILEKYSPGYSMERFIEQMKDTLASEDNKEIVDFYKMTAADIIYVEEKDVLLIKDRRYIYDKWVTEVANGNAAAPDFGDSNILYTEKKYEIFVECDVYEKYYKDAVYELPILSIVKKFDFEIDENGDIIADGMDEIIAEIFDYGVTTAWVEFDPLRLVMKGSELEKVAEEAEELKNLSETYKLYVERDFAAMLALVEELAQKKEDVKKFLDENLSTDEAKNRVKEFIQNECEFYNGSFYFEKDSEYGTPVGSWKPVKWFASEQSLDVSGIFSLFEEIEYYTR